MSEDQEIIIDVPPDPEDEEKAETKNASKKSINKKEKTEKADKAPKIPTKVVVRRLPPTMTEEFFLESVSPLAEHDYLCFVEADKSLEPHAFSRAYVNFLNPEDVFIFRDKFDGYVFIDAKGNEFPAVVEFAPYQKVPKKDVKKRPDAKTGTIESDPDYLKFLEEYENEDKTQSTLTMDQHLEEIEAKMKERAQLESQTTPLLEYLKEKREEIFRQREAKREMRKKKEEEKRKAKEEERKKARVEGEKKKDKDDKMRSSKQDKRGPMDKNRSGQEEVKILKKGKEGDVEEKLQGKDNDFKKKREEQKRKQREKQKEKREMARNKAKAVKEASHDEAKPRDKTEPRQQFEQNSATGKPKKYSDRRKEEQMKREMAKIEGDDKEPEETSEKSVKSVEKAVKKMTLQDDEEPEVPMRDDDEEAKEKRRAELRAKREKERQERKERLKKKEKEIYRPGMGKFSSQSIKKEDNGEADNPARSGAGFKRGGSRGGTRVFYNSGRNKNNRDSKDEGNDEESSQPPEG